VVLFNLQNPVFAAYLIAAAIMVLKLMAQGWVTVFRMIGSDGGLLNPEDLQPGPANRNPRPEQLEANELVERSRRIQRNDLENIPAFLAIGLLFVAVGPPLLLARTLFIAFVAARLAHTLAYTTRQRHEVRALFYAIGSVVVIVMALYVLVTTLLPH
jgi:glutathione S-transferase